MSLHVSSYFTITRYTRKPDGTYGVSNITDNIRKDLESVSFIGKNNSYNECSITLKNSNRIYDVDMDADKGEFYVVTIGTDVYNQRVFKGTVWNKSFEYGSRNEFCTITLADMTSMFRTSDALSEDSRYKVGLTGAHRYYTGAPILPPAYSIETTKRDYVNERKDKEKIAALEIAVSTAEADYEAEKKKKDVRGTKGGPGLGRKFGILKRAKEALRAATASSARVTYSSSVPKGKTEPEVQDDIPALEAQVAASEAAYKKEVEVRGNNMGVKERELKDWKAILSRAKERKAGTPAKTGDDSPPVAKACKFIGVRDSAIVGFSLVDTGEGNIPGALSQFSSLSGYSTLYKTNTAFNPKNNNVDVGSQFNIKVADFPKDVGHYENEVETSNLSLELDTIRLDRDGASMNSDRTVNGDPESWVTERVLAVPYFLYKKGILEEPPTVRFSFTDEITGKPLFSGYRWQQQCIATRQMKRPGSTLKGYFCVKTSETPLMLSHKGETHQPPHVTDDIMIENLAAKHFYVTFVKNDILFFIPPRIKSRPKAVFEWGSNVDSFIADLDTLNFGGTARVFYNGTEYTLNDNNYSSINTANALKGQLDEAAQKSLDKTVANDQTDIKNNTFYKGGRVTSSSIATNASSPEDALMIARSIMANTQWVLKGTLIPRKGTPLVDENDTVELKNFGKNLDGLWYISKASKTLTGTAGFNASYTLTRRSMNGWMSAEQSEFRGGSSLATGKFGYDISQVEPGSISIKRALAIIEDTTEERIGELMKAEAEAISKRKEEGKPDVLKKLLRKSNATN